MPMLKTAGCGTSSVVKVRSYLMREQRKSVEQAREALDLYRSDEARFGREEERLLEGYLQSNSRSLAVDVSADLTDELWAEQMDLTRIRYGHDRSGPFHRGRANRTYYHFILSPAMEDVASLETLRAYTVDWAEECFRRGGRLCEYAIAYHRDNEKGVLHAHIIVNATNKAAGRKLHLDNSESVGLQLTAQEVGRKHCLTPLREQMQPSKGARTTQPVYMEKCEREILARGERSWKMDLRLKVLELAELSADFEDFQERMAVAGCAVEKDEVTGYLTYIDHAGNKARDCRLGASFYTEALEVMFVCKRDRAELADQARESMRAMAGELPWKDEIARAVDAACPMVLSIPELRHALETLHGIRLTVNRQGIVYQHPSGLKARDIAIGTRYTPDGLLRSAVVCEAEPFPTLEEVREATADMQRRSPDPFVQVSDTASDEAAGKLLTSNFAEMMTRRGASSISELDAALKAERWELEDRKAELLELRDKVTRWQRIATGRAERGATSSEAGGDDPAEMHARLSEEYAAQLETHSCQVAKLFRDQSLAREYGVSVRSQTDWQKFLDGEGVLDIEALLSANAVFSKYDIDSFADLDELIASKELEAEAMQEKIDAAGREMRRLQSLQADAKTCQGLEGRPPDATVPEGGLDDPILAVEKFRYKDAARRIEAAGISAGDYEHVQRDCLMAELRYNSLKGELERLYAAGVDLKGARKVCRQLENSMLRRGFPWSENPERGKGLLGDIPFDKAKEMARLANEKRQAKKHEQEEMML